MPTNKIGIANLSETTSLLTKDALQKAQGVLPDSASVAVRPGYHVHCFFTDSGVPILPLHVAGGNIGGEPLIIVAAMSGFVYVSPVNRLGKFYVLDRRYFKFTESIYLFNRDGIFSGIATSVDNQNTAKTAKIITISKNIYVLSNEQCWLIRGDGMILFDDDKMTCTVDALNATITDIDNETPKLHNVGRTCSVLKKDDRVYVRAKSELGGYGAPSVSVKVPETNGYIVYGIKGMTNTCKITRENVTI